MLVGVSLKSAARQLLSRLVWKEQGLSMLRQEGQLASVRGLSAESARTDFLRTSGVARSLHKN